MEGQLILHDAPAPIVLPSLNFVLRRFHGSYHTTATALIAFDWIMKYATNEFGDAERTSAWQDLLADLRDPNQVPLYRDPESLQVAQALSRLDPLVVLRELSANTHAGCEIISKRVSGASTDVPCGGYWLAACAKLGLGTPSTPAQELFVQHVDHLSFPQPVYAGPDTTGMAVATHSIAEAMIFRPNGILWSAATLASRGDTMELFNLVQCIVRIAMDVADVWTFTLDEGIREVRDFPPWKWYYFGMRHSREIFAAVITNYPEEPQDLLSYKVRDALKTVSFVVLWDWLWQNARDLCEVYRAEDNDPVDRLQFDLNRVVLLPFSKMEFISNTELRADMTAAANQEFDESTYLRPSKHPVLIDFEDIDETNLGHLECHWGRRFYGDELPRGFSTDLETVLAIEVEMRANAGANAIAIPEEFLVDIEDEAELEAFGPLIDPAKFATVVGEASQPEGQNCTICAEPYEPYELYKVEQRCLRLENCGHYFHEDCLADWMNGVARNSNLCPECREQICVERRKVRVKESAHSDAGAVSLMQWNSVMERYLYSIDPLEDLDI
jgi:hypothetical protein